MMPPIEFGEPLYLWLLLLPAGLALLWVWQLVRRRGDARRAWHERTTPVRERYAFAGGLAFWLKATFNHQITTVTGLFGGSAVAYRNQFGGCLGRIVNRMRRHRRNQGQPIYKSV